MSILKRNTLKIIGIAVLLSGALCLANVGLVDAKMENNWAPGDLQQYTKKKYDDHRPVEGKWMSGDFHQHTNYTDGSDP